MSVQRVHTWCNAAAPPRPPILFRSFFFGTIDPSTFMPKRHMCCGHINFIFESTYVTLYFFYTQFSSIIFAQRFRIFSSPKVDRIPKSINQLFFREFFCNIKFVKICVNFFRHSYTFLRIIKIETRATQNRTSRMEHIKCSAQSDKRRSSRVVFL